MELAEKTNIPDTTIRRYIAKFPDFFQVKGGSRSRRYEDTAIKVLVRIKNLFDNGYETDQVDAKLRHEFPMVVDGDKTEEPESHTPTLATAEDITEIKQALSQQSEALHEFNKLLLEKLDQQQRYIDEKLEKRDQLLMESIRVSQEEKRALIEMAASSNEKKKGFFTRLFGGGK